MKVGDTFVLNWGVKSGILSREDKIIKIVGNIIIGKIFEVNKKHVKIKK